MQKRSESRKKWVHKRIVWDIQGHQWVSEKKKTCEVHIESAWLTGKNVYK